MTQNTFYLDYNVTGAERKRLVEAISAYTQADAKYLGAPTFAYEVDYFTIDKNGCVSFDDRADSEEIEGLIETLVGQGFVAQVSDLGCEEAAQDADFLESIGCSVLRMTKAARYEIRGGLKADTVVVGGEEHKVDGIFVIKDTVSVTKLVQGLAYSDGGIVTDRKMQTNVPGVFAAGDCTGKPYQLAKAAGEGNVAALSACEYIDNNK